MADKSVRIYELFYLILDSKESEMSEIRKQVEGVVSEFGGTFLPEGTEEKRNLAYEIRKERRGTYAAYRFTLPVPGDEPVAERKEEPVNAIDAIDRKLRLLDGVARFMLVRAERLPELKAIPREERPRKRRDDRRGGRRPALPKPVPGRAEKVEETKRPAADKIDQEKLDKQLEEVLDI